MDGILIIDKPSGITSYQVVKKVKKIRPHIKVIYVSGYTDNHIVHEGLLEKGVNFINKPFSIETLASRIRQILDNE